MESTIRQLQQRNEVLEEGIANIRSSLETNRAPSVAQTPRISSETLFENIASPSVTEPATESSLRSEPSPTTNPNTTTYLLSIHESLREEVSQLSTALSDLDVRASMSIMNENLRLREDMAHISAGLNTVRMQVHMLINSRLQQGQQRTMGARPTQPNANGGMGGLDMPGPSNSAGQSRMPPDVPERPRRLSDNREGTKL